MSGFMKTRALPTGNRNFGDQARKTSTFGKGSTRKPIVGEYNAFYPKEDKALWIALCPTQSWEYDLWDRETRDVVHFTDQYYFAYNRHYVARTKRSFQCSAGAHRNKPCWGCGVRNHFYDQQRAVEERTGVKPKGEPPISAGNQFALGCVLLETMVKRPVLDQAGKQRMTRDNKPIMRDVPLCTLTPVEQKQYKAQGGTSFGMPVHWSVGRLNLDELLGFDEELKNKCANCASDLQVIVAACPECATEMLVVEDENTPLTGQDLAEMRKQSYKCDCGYFGELIPMPSCECGSPEEGKLVDFALRIKTEKVGDKQKQLKLVEVKPLRLVVEKYPAVEAMLMESLKLNEIFAPTNLSFQLNLIPQELRGDGVSPDPQKRKSDEPVAESYELGGGSDSDD